MFVSLLLQNCTMEKRNCGKPTASLYKEKQKPQTSHTKKNPAKQAKNAQKLHALGHSCFLSCNQGKSKAQ